MISYTRKSTGETRVAYECQDCGKKFSRGSPPWNGCPKCKSHDIDLATS